MRKKSPFSFFTQAFIFISRVSQFKKLKVKACDYFSQFPYIFFLHLKYPVSVTGRKFSETYWRGFISTSQFFKENWNTKSKINRRSSL